MCGLFSRITYGATVKNVKFENVSIAVPGAYGVGVIAGFCNYGTGALKIDNVRLESGTISGGSSSVGYVDSYIGRKYNQNGKTIQITNSYSNITIK